MKINLNSYYEIPRIGGIDGKKDVYQNGVIFLGKKNLGNLLV